ncbi:hypothetical protein [Arthrobacter sp. CG_A4]|uniref:hypothetical protein n=1 Tax=Arthrobacter sp. CG_A4 TaxID=3071706 RepID=UPI002DFF28FE|nr:hypothetical protein [Arthrobacter sp. CG_A4]
MPTKTTEHDIAGFGAKDWTGKPLKESGTLFLGSGFLTFILCLILMIFIPPLRDAIVIIVICTLVAVIVMCSTIVSNVKRDKACLRRITEQVNAFILELTGDPTARINPGMIETLIFSKRRGVLLNINGVPGVEVKAVPKPDEMTSFVARLTPPDFGLESFDVLLDAERKRKS